MLPRRRDGSPASSPRGRRFWPALLAAALAAGAVAWWLAGTLIAGAVVASVTVAAALRVRGGPGDRAVRELEFRRGFVDPPGAPRDAVERPERD